MLSLFFSNTTEVMEYFQSESESAISFKHQILTEPYMMVGVGYWKSLKFVCAEKTDCRRNVTKRRSLNANRSVYSISFNKEQKQLSDSISFLLDDSSGVFWSVDQICWEPGTSDLLTELSNAHVKHTIIQVYCSTHLLHTSIHRHSLLWQILPYLYRIHNNSH